MQLATGILYRFDIAAVDRFECGRNQRENPLPLQALEHQVLAFEHVSGLPGVGDFEHEFATRVVDQKIQVALAVQGLERSLQRKQAAGDSGRFAGVKFGQQAAIGHGGTGCKRRHCTRCRN